MFELCIKLESISINLNKFDTSSVTNMEYMFSNCKYLIILNVYKFNVSSVTLEVSNLFRLI